MRYRRSQASGATFFFTVVTYKRRRILCCNENVSLINEGFKHAVSKRPFVIDAFVMLPDHIHCIWTLPEGDNDFSTRWWSIKSYFTRRCNTKHKDDQSDNMKIKGMKGVRQQRFWEHQIRDERDFAAHVDYIHYNPVKHGYAKAPKDWEWSTFHRYVREGIYDINWGTKEEPVG